MIKVSSGSLGNPEPVSEGGNGENTKPGDLCSPLRPPSQALRATTQISVSAYLPLSSLQGESPRILTWARESC